jgi:hypothetical protein
MDKKAIAGIIPAELKLLCDEYDKECGDYPEHEYEGAAFFEYYKKVMGVEYK